MSETQQILTIGECAKICKVAPRTVAKWFDSGMLKGYRIPGSRDRRVPRKYLEAFLKEHGPPTEELDAPQRQYVGLYDEPPPRAVQLDDMFIIRATAPVRDDDGNHTKRGEPCLWLVEGGKAWRLDNCKAAPGVPVEWLEVVR